MTSSTNETKKQSRTVLPVRLVRQAADLLMKHVDGQKTSEREVRSVIDRLRAACDEDSIIEADEVRPQVAIVRVFMVTDPKILVDDDSSQNPFDLDWSGDVPTN